MQRYLVLLVTVFLAASAFAQPDPNAPAQPQRQPGGRGMPGGMLGAGMNALASMSPAELAILPEGVFVLRGGVLAKFTADTLQPAGMLQLFDPLPARPAMPENPTPQDQAALRDWMAANLARNAPAATLAQDGRLHLVIGSSYFRVKAATMEVDAKGGLEAQDGRRIRMQVSAPVLKLENNVLYVILGQELLTVEPDTGKVAARIALPLEMFPAQGALGGALGNVRGDRPARGDRRDAR